MTMALNADSENQRASAFEWLMEDPDHRAIESPTRLDAVLNLYAAREAYPAATLTTDQFTCTCAPTPSARESRVLALHLWCN